MSEDKYVGGHVVAIWHRSLHVAVDELLVLGQGKLSRLKVRSGEHLAAILITAFLGTAPRDIDLDGGVDLFFDLQDSTTSMLGPLLGGSVAAAFEIKSMPGPFREFDSGLDRAEMQGRPALGASLEVQVRAANDILSDAAPLLARAVASLRRKTATGISRHAFLIVHPFDHLAIECIESSLIAKALAPPPEASSFETIWVLWVPDHLTLWSAVSNEWTDLVFCATNPDEEVPEEWGSLAVLQAVESDFLNKIGTSTRSPYIFGFQPTEES